MLKRTIEVAFEAHGYFRESSSDTVLNMKPRIQLDGYSCGMQSLAAVLDYYDFEIDYDDLAATIGLTKDGCDEIQLRRAIRAYDMKHRTWSRMSLKRLRTCIDNEHPVLVSVNKERHWSVVYGYGDGVIYLMNPSLSAFKHGGKRTEEEFLDYWDTRWGMEVFTPPRKRAPKTAPRRAPKCK